MHQLQTKKEKVIIKLMKDDLLSLLNITDPNLRQDENLVRKIYEDATRFLLEKFVDSLSKQQQQDILSELHDIKTPDQVFTAISKYDPDFATKKSIFLQEYIKKFNLRSFQ